MKSASSSPRLSRLSVALLPALISLAYAVPVHAAGFAVAQQNGAGLGNAYAGSGAVAEDASTIWFNPAGMTRLPEGHSIALAASGLNRKLEFGNTGSNPVNALIPLGNNGGDAGGTSFIPAGYYAYAVSPELRIGIGLSGPFGNKTEYENNFLGRYQGTSSDIKAININPSVAWQVNDMVSLGFGISHMKLEAELESKAPVVVGLTYLGDANVKLDGDDTAWSYNLGALIQLSPSTRIGITYRGRTRFTVKGTVQVSSAFAPASTQDVSVPIKLPDSFSLSVFQTVNERWEMMGDLTRTGWSSLPALTVQNTAGATISNEALNYKDSWRLGLGMNYKLDEQWKLHFGVAYDKTPIPDEASRIVRLPDSDRTWLAFGARWNLGKASSLDFGYAHIFFKDADINRRTVLNGANTAQSVIGTYKTSADLFAVQYNASF